MNRETVVAGVAGLVIGILIAPVFSPAMPTMWGNRMMGGNYRGGSQVMGQIDAHFIEQMVPHHEDAITMANLALTRAEHSQIRSLANDIIRSQSEEIEQMKQWYKSWFGKDVPDTFAGTGHGMGSGMMHMGMMGDATDIDDLKTATPFDRAFIEEMIPHHQMAVMMAQMLLNSTDRPEMKQLAKDIISAQTKEIDEMRDWYRDWYGR